MKEPTCKKERVVFGVTNYGTMVWRLANTDGTKNADGLFGEFAIYPTRDEAEMKLTQMQTMFPHYSESYKIVTIPVRVFDEARDIPQYEDGWNDVNLQREEGDY